MQRSIGCYWLTLLLSHWVSCSLAHPLLQRPTGCIKGNYSDGETREEWNAKCSSTFGHLFGSNWMLATVDYDSALVPKKIRGALYGMDDYCLIGLKGSQNGDPIWEDGTVYEKSQFFNFEVT